MTSGNVITHNVISHNLTFPDAEKIRILSSFDYY